MPLAVDTATLPRDAQAPVTVPVEEALLDDDTDLLVEDVSIDGMCGVY